MTESLPGATNALREALAAADAAEAEAAHYKQQYFDKGAESQKWAARAGEADAALAAARRECEGLRKVLDVARAALESGQDLWPAIQQARAALSSEGESK